MPSSHINDRYLELDLLRTIAIILMIVYHAAFDLSYFFGLPFDPVSGIWLILQRLTANLFLALVGISFMISWSRAKAQGTSKRMIVRKYVKRTAILLACAAAVSLATYAMEPQTYVRFGVLHLIGIAALILPLLAPLREWNAALALVAFALGQVASSTTVVTSALLPLGLYPATFSSLDYFPLFPWLAPILFGLALGNFLYVRGALRWHLPATKASWLLTAPGRFALVIYLAHQPVLILIFSIVLRISR